MGEYAHGSPLLVCYCTVSLNKFKYENSTSF